MLFFFANICPLCYIINKKFSSNMKIINSIFYLLGLIYKNKSNRFKNAYFLFHFCIFLKKVNLIKLNSCSIFDIKLPFYNL